MKEVLLEKKGDIGTLDWLVLAKHYTRNGEEEMAYQCYMLAHLKDHTHVKANSDLKFETLSAPNA